MNITQDYLAHLFNYNNGVLYWKNPTNKKIKKGAIVGNINKYGYIHTSINGKRYLNHRLIFLLVKGYLPEFLDHINTIRTDNRIENLRPATKEQNSHNANLRKDNNSGVKGVSWHPKMKKWYARIGFSNRSKYLGSYNSLQEAKQSIEIARQKLHKEYAKHE